MTSTQMKFISDEPPSINLDDKNLTWSPKKSRYYQRSYKYFRKKIKETKNSFRSGVKQKNRKRETKWLKGENSSQEQGFADYKVGGLANLN